MHSISATAILVAALLTAAAVVSIAVSAGAGIAAARRPARPPAFPESFALLCRSTSSHAADAASILLPSLVVFWRPAPRLHVVLDAESPDDAAFASSLLSWAPALNITVSFEPPPPDDGLNGWGRQQWSTFYADQAVGNGTEFVGIVDTDTLFTTPVSPSLLFQGGKPVVIALVGAPKAPFWVGVAKTTAFVLKRKYLLHCMNYFPVIIKPSHLASLRRHVSALHGRPFDGVFAAAARMGEYSQFDIICNYLWHHHPLDYSFHLQERKPKPGVRWDDLDDGHRVRDLDWVPESMASSALRVAIHWRGTPFFRSRDHTAVLRRSLCAAADAVSNAGGVPWCPPGFRRGELRDELFCFGNTCWVDATSTAKQRAHHQSLIGGPWHRSWRAERLATLPQRFPSLFVTAGKDDNATVAWSERSRRRAAGGAGNASRARVAPESP